MDIVINAAIQSPLFRNLSHIPADRLAFSHHITSNAPPLSKTKITVMPATAHNSLDADYQFRVPQFGFLNKVVLRLEYDILPVTRFQVTPLLPLYHIIQEISLRTHHKPIQTIYGKEMLVKHAYFSEPSDKGIKFLGTLNPPARPGVVDLGEMFKDPETGKPYNPVADISKAATRKRRVTMLVEVPLASTEAPHVNFDTRFVEHLDLYVKLTSTNGGDVPIGMAAGLMEQDLAQDFNVDPIGEGPVEEDLLTWNWFTFGGVKDDASVYTYDGNALNAPSYDSDWGTTAAVVDGNIFYGIVETCGANAQNITQGLPLRITFAAAGTATLAAPTVSDGTAADEDAGQITAWTGVAGDAVTVAAAGAGKHGMIVRCLAVGQQPTNVNQFYLADGYADFGAGASGLRNRPTVADVSGTLSRRNIVNWRREGKTTVINNGPSIATPAAGVNSVGTPSHPVCAMNWVRIGTGHFAQDDYAGWGRAATDKLFDTHGGALSWSADARTVASSRIAAFNKPTGADDPLGRKATATTYLNTHTLKTNRQIEEFNGGGLADGALVGTRDVQAALERYYTLYPHLNTAVCPPGSTPSIDKVAYTPNVIPNEAADDGAAVANLTNPALLGGRANNAAAFTAGADSINTAVPRNIGLSLSCTFLNYHDKIREDIATENFKDNAPATILQYDTQQEIVNAKYGDTNSSYALKPYEEMVVHLKSNHLAYAISILAFRNKTPQELAGATARDGAGRSISLSDGPINDFGCTTTGGADQDTLSNCRFPAYQVVENFKTVKPTYVAVKGSGRPIYECGIDAVPSSTGLDAQFCPKNGRGRIPGAGNALAEGDLDNLSFNYNRTEGYGSVQGPETVASDFLTGTDRRITGELADHCSAHVISWGLNTTDQLANSGSLALQTINQPTLHLRFPEKCRVYVYVHHFSMIQIDANTGSISKSLDV